MRTFENHLQVDSLYTDCSKAFDRVNHKLLLYKLQTLGFGGEVLKWLNSFLVGRSQHIHIQNYVSHDISVFSGVPQASHCGPLLFLVFVNDINLFIKESTFLMFADDLKIFKGIKSQLDCDTLQNDVNGLYQWSK